MTRSVMRHALWEAPFGISPPGRPFWLAQTWWRATKGVEARRDTSSLSLRGAPSGARGNVAIAPCGRGDCHAPARPWRTRRGEAAARNDVPEEVAPQSH